MTRSARRRVSRVLSRRSEQLRGGDGHSSGALVAKRLLRPTRAAARRFARHHRIAPRCLPLLLGLAPGGVFPAAAVAGGAVRSYRTVSPLPPARANPGGAGGVLSVALSLGSPPPGVTRHRTSVEPGLSSPRASAASGHPAVWHRRIWVVAAPLSKPAQPGLRLQTRPGSAIRETFNAPRLPEATLSPSLSATIARRTKVTTE